MAHNVAQCKAMCRVAKEQGKYLAVGHQRHYSILYDNAVHLIKSGVFGELHHIRAQWHRGNLPGNDSWQQPLPGGELSANGEKIDKVKRQLDRLKNDLAKETDAVAAEKLAKKVAQWEAWQRDAKVEAEKHGYAAFSLGSRQISALEELCRWRLWERTGGGLMAELGSHQLDAATIFCSALRNDGKKAHPLSVHALGGRYTFGLDRHAEDHVYCMFEFPGPGYEPEFNVGYKDDVLSLPPPGGIPSFEQDPNKKIVVTYSSINGNGYGGYGEVVMGTRGTLILEREKEVMIYKDADTATRVGMMKNEKGAAVLDTQASGKTAAVAKAAEGPVSRGYQEEIEHWAWCIRNPAPENQPRCKGEIALGDAVIALATNVAIKNANSGKGGYLAFDEAWYEVDKPETPDGSSVEEELKKLSKI
jgi:predicted dehydrogenase